MVIFRLIEFPFERAPTASKGALACLGTLILIEIPLNPMQMGAYVLNGICIVELPQFVENAMISEDRMKIYTPTTNVFLSVVPLVVSIRIYLKANQQLMRSLDKLVKPGEKPSAMMIKRQKENHTITKMFTYTIIAQSCCIFPGQMLDIVYYILFAATDEKGRPLIIRHEAALITVMITARRLAVLHMAIAPIFYSGMHKSLKTFRQFFSKRCKAFCCCFRKSKQTSLAASRNAAPAATSRRARIGQQQSAVFNTASVTKVTEKDGRVMTKSDNLPADAITRVEEGER